MLSCRDVTERASRIVDGELPARERFGVRVHLLLCSHCRRFLGQMRGLTGAVRLRGQQDAAAAIDPALLERIVTAMQQAPRPPDQPPT